MNLLDTLKSQVRTKLSNQESLISGSGKDNAGETLDHVTSSSPKRIFQRIVTKIGGNHVLDLLARPETVTDDESDKPVDIDIDNTQLTKSNPTSDRSKILADKKIDVSSIWNSAKDVWSQGKDRLTQAVSASDDSKIIETDEAVENIEIVEDTVELGSEKVSSVWTKIKEPISNGVNRLKDTLSTSGQSNSAPTTDDSSNKVGAVEDNSKEKQTVLNNKSVSSNDTVEGTTVIVSSTLTHLKKVLNKGVGVLKNTATDFSTYDSISGMAKTGLAKSTETIKKSKAVFDSSESWADAAKHIFIRGVQNRHESLPDIVETEPDKVEQVIKDIVDSDVEIITDTVIEDSNEVAHEIIYEVEDSSVSIDQYENTPEISKINLDETKELIEDNSVSDIGISTVDIVADKRVFDSSKPPADPANSIFINQHKSTPKTIETEPDKVEEVIKDIVDSDVEIITDIIIEDSNEVAHGVIYEAEDSSVSIDQYKNTPKISKINLDKTEEVIEDNSVSDIEISTVDIVAGNEVALTSTIEAIFKDSIVQNASTQEITDHLPMPEMVSESKKMLENTDKVVDIAGKGSTDFNQFSELPEKIVKSDTGKDTIVFEKIDSTKNTHNSSLELIKTVVDDTTDTSQQEAQLTNEEDLVIRMEASTTIETELKSLNSDSEVKNLSVTTDLDGSEKDSVAKDVKEVDTHSIQSVQTNKHDIVSAIGSDTDKLMNSYIPPLEKSTFHWVLPVVFLALLSIAGWLIHINQLDQEVDFAMLESPIVTNSEHSVIIPTNELKADLLLDVSTPDSKNNTSTLESEGIDNETFNSLANTKVILEMSGQPNDLRTQGKVTDGVVSSMGIASLVDLPVGNVAENINNNSGNVETGIVAMIGKESLRSTEREVEQSLQKGQINNPVDAIAHFLQREDGSLPSGFILYGLNFETASSRMSDNSDRIISDLAAMLEAYPNTRIRLEGHTDNRGNDDANQVLSFSRAKAVKAALISLNLDPTRISAVGLGEDYPIMDNATKVGQSNNRRVEVIVTER